MQATGQKPTFHPLERFTAILAAILCASHFFILWRSLVSYQKVWPLPGLYFLEMAVLAALGAYVFLTAQARLTVVSWGAAGALLAFCILGAWSVGFLYLPATLMLGIVSLTSDLRNRQRLIRNLGVFLLAGLAQAGLILAAVRSEIPPPGPQTASALRATDAAIPTLSGAEPAPSAMPNRGSGMLPPLRGSIPQSGYHSTDNRERRPPPMPGLRGLAWSPGGARLAIISGPNLYIIETRK